jgi:hypothetical protein
MYRPKKKKIVRRVSVASVVAVLSAVGLGVALFGQGGGANSAAGTPARASTTTSAHGSSGTSSSAKYHLVSRTLEDAHSSESVASD